MDFCTLASGSSGNATLVSCGKTHILIDAGISMRRICYALRTFGLEPCDLSAILITHEHSDHVRGLASMTKYFSIPVLASTKTAIGLALAHREICDALNGFETGKPFEIGEIEVQSFLTPHDTPESVGYRLTGKNSSLAVITDLGHVNDSVLEAVKGVNAAIIEANHDVEMLKKGSYPRYLKRRILGDYGHLSNEAGAELAVNLITSGTYQLILAHLSRDNNTPELAFSSVNFSLYSRGIVVGRDFDLAVAPRDTVGRRYTI